ncbi:MAG: phosphoribosylamine--glycine ligase [Tannerellaceae bacterium]|jgi:phosphoribosylamine--glycine ligase|nr:phosphoribosylamine--glycine ligase [Tannerellaceae bacterium]
MNILLLGSGGREHALAWKIRQSDKVDRLFIAPGNAGTAAEGVNVDMDVTDFDAIRAFVLDNGIDMMVVGPEEPLVRGVYDFFGGDPALKGIPVIGPSRRGAMLEGSKAFAKAFMMRHGIPTARYKSVTMETVGEGYAFLDSLAAPYVLKADGLAGGKGVLIVGSVDEARRELSGMLGGGFGDAGRTVVIEEFLDGIECSVFALTDGRDYKTLPVAKDYKRAGEGDTGLNTGGMGAVSPVAFADRAFMEKVDSRIIRPTVEGIRAEGIDYRGFIFFGLINVGGEPFVIEYNCRMGDPETEVVMPRIKEDLVGLFEAVAERRLGGMTVSEEALAAATVVVVSGGYPGVYQKGKTITGLTDSKTTAAAGTLIFHAGTKASGCDIVTSGGRVIAVTSLGRDIGHALRQSYRVIGGMGFEGMYYRSDIGFDLM